MPYLINGWVEIARFEKAEHEDEYAWQGVINLRAFVDTADMISERLFGLTKKWQPEDGAVAARRGLPRFPSQEVKKEVEKIIEHEQRFGPGEYGGYTYATWKEIKAVSLASDTISRSDWKIVFDFAACLEQDGRFSSDRIRLVVWYEW